MGQNHSMCKRTQSQDYEERAINDIEEEAMYGQKGQIQMRPLNSKAVDRSSMEQQPKVKMGKFGVPESRSTLIARDLKVNPEEHVLKTMESPSKIEFSKMMDDNCDYEESETSENISEPRSAKIRFQWSYGGKEVFLNGSFTDWGYMIKLKKNKVGQTNIFEVSLTLKEGIHYYHFVVDGKIRFAPDQPSSINYQQKIVNFIEVDKQLISKVEYQLRIIKGEDNSILTTRQSHHIAGNFEAMWNERLDFNIQSDDSCSMEDDNTDTNFDKSTKDGFSFFEKSTARGDNDQSKFEFPKMAQDESHIAMQQDPKNITKRLRFVPTSPFASEVEESLW